MSVQGGKHARWPKTLTSLLRCLAGYLLASAIAGIIQVSFVLSSLDLAASGSDRWMAAGIWMLLAAFHSGIFGAPVAIAALAIAEWKGIYRPAYYVATGLSIAAAGFLAQLSSAQQSIGVSLYVLAALSTAGASAGFVYWLASGRRAGKWR